MSVCKLCAEELELRVVRFQYMVERYLSLFADVSNRNAYYGVLWVARIFFVILL